MSESRPPDLNRLRGVRALVTGGAGLIGSHIVDRLAEAGAAEIIVIDDLSRGRRAWLTQAFASGRVSLVEGDVRDRNVDARQLLGECVGDARRHLRRLRRVRQDVRQTHLPLRPRFVPSCRKGPTSFG